MVATMRGGHFHPARIPAKERQVEVHGNKKPVRDRPNALRHQPFLVVAALVLLPVLGASGDVQTELVPEMNAFIKLGKRVRLLMLADLTYGPRSWTAEGAETVQELEIGANVDVTLKPMLRRKVRPLSDWERERYLWMRVGYNYVTTLGNPAEPSHENRGIFEVTTRQPLPLSRVSWAVLRNRVEFRDRNGVSFTRYRSRLTLENERTLFGKAAVPYVSAEVLYDTRYDAWNEQRYQAGVEVVLDKRWRYEVYYQRNENQRSQTRHTNQVGLVLKYYN